MKDIFNENVPLKTETPAFEKHVLPAVPSSEVYLEDCVTALKRFKDNHFDLAIVDPPYGLGMHKAQGTTKAKPKKWCGGDWDNETPTTEYWNELFRVSKNQIVWGANYFMENLNSGKKWIVWDKMLDQDQSHLELAWTSFVGAERMYRYSRSKLQGFQNPNRFHPTEKPISLYEFLIKEFAKEGDLILDTHLGSGSSRIAAYKGGFNFVGFEIDQEYYEKQEKRFNDFKSQLRLF
jgi:site-specific DNA-methyltransferase (adenine-specific)